MDANKRCGLAKPACLQQRAYCCLRCLLSATSAAVAHCLQILVLAIFFQQAPLDAGLQVMGLVCAIFGLMAFLEVRRAKKGHKLRAGSGP